MYIKFFVTVFVIFPFALFALEFDQPGETSSCVLSLTTKLLPAISDDKSGRAIVEVFLKEKSGHPVAGKQIQLTASWGTFYCRYPIPQDSAGKNIDDDQDCYITDQNGKVRVHLVNLVIGEVVKVKATCDCGGYFVNASGNLVMKVVPAKK